MKKLLCSIFLILIAFPALKIVPARIYAINSPVVPQTLISGRDWAYTVNGAVKNKADIEKLIQCESQGVNIARPDSNGLISWGVAQFNGTSTWAEFSKQSGITGSPMIPADAIRMMDWAISNGFLGRWSCSRILGLTR